jgi:hypothetical protein
MVAKIRSRLPGPRIIQILPTTASSTSAIRDIISAAETYSRSGFYEGSHHQLAKGDRILAARPRHDLVPAPFKAKIDGYLSYWQDKYNGEWPVYPTMIPRQSRLKASERIADQLYFRLLRRFDDVTAAVYSWAPIKLLRRYRGSKRTVPAGSQTVSRA